MANCKFPDFTEDDVKLHDYIITHNRKLKDIRTIVNNIMWSLYALRDAFDMFDFISLVENDISSIIASYGFSPSFRHKIYDVIDNIKHEYRANSRGIELQTIAHMLDSNMNDLLKIAKKNIAELKCE